MILELWGSACLLLAAGLMLAQLFERAPQRFEHGEYE